jgi:hypothetical protein
MLETKGVVSQKTVVVSGSGTLLNILPEKQLN